VLKGSDMHGGQAKPTEVSVGNYEWKNNMRDICMDGRMIFRSDLKDLTFTGTCIILIAE
jgi:hypothetical protein